MVRHRLIPLVLSFALIATPATAFADGGVLGIQYSESGRYNGEGAIGAKVTSVQRISNFTNLRPGDYIVTVNNQRFRSLDEFNRLVSRHDVGANVTIGFFRKSDGYRTQYFQSAALLAPVGTTSFSSGVNASRTAVDPAAPAGKASFSSGVSSGVNRPYLALPPQPVQSNARTAYAPPPSPVVEEEQGVSTGEVLAWGAGIIIAGCLLGILCSSDSSDKGGGHSGGDSSTSNSFDPALGRSRPYTPPEIQTRPDTSVGCYWGDRATGTCH